MDCTQARALVRPCSWGSLKGQHVCALVWAASADASAALGSKHQCAPVHRCEEIRQRARRWNCVTGAARRGPRSLKRRDLTMSPGKARLCGECLIVRRRSRAARHQSAAVCCVNHATTAMQGHPAAQEPTSMSHGTHPRPGTPTVVWRTFLFVSTHEHPLALLLAHPLPAPVSAGRGRQAHRHSQRLFRPGLWELLVSRQPGNAGCLASVVLGKATATHRQALNLSKVGGEAEVAVVHVRKGQREQHVVRARHEHTAGRDVLHAQG